MKITNYTLEEFLQQPEELIREYTAVLKLLDPIPTANNLIDLSLEKVEYIKQNLYNQEELVTIFGIMEGTDEKGLMAMPITTFYGLYNSIISQLQDILDMEEQHLSTEYPDFKWEAVEGSKKLSVLGILPMVDTLAGGDILRYNIILRQPYLTVFKKLMLDRIKSDLQVEMSKIKTKTND